MPDPVLADLYRQKLDNLRESLTADIPTQVKVATQLRALINKIEVHPMSAKRAVRLKVVGDMSGVFGLSEGVRKTAVQVVAEEG